MNPVTTPKCHPAPPSLILTQPPPSACWSPAVRLRNSWRDWTETRLQVQMVSAPGSQKPVLNIYRSLQHFDLNQKRRQAKIPMLCKTSCLVHVSKISPICYHWLQKGWLKVLERLSLAHLNRQVFTFQDPLQFVYSLGVGVEYTIMYLLSKQHGEHHILQFLHWN